MLKINQFYWNLFKNSEEGKNSIKQFEQLSKNYDSESNAKLLTSYNPEFLLNFDSDEIIDMFSTIARYFHTHNIKQACIESHDAKEIGKLAMQLVSETNLAYFFPATFYLSKLYPDYFIPYMFFARFNYFQEIIDNLDLDLNDKIPGEANIQKRLNFYLDICDELYKYRALNDLSPYELCAVLYDMERLSFDSETVQESTTYPRVWWIVGAKTYKETRAKALFYQGNKEMRKGDIAVFYEKSDTFNELDESDHRSSITGIWTVASDGNIDPFFWYYRYCILVNEIKVEPIKFSIFSKDPLTCNIHGVSAHMQNYSGHEIPLNEYERILKLLEKYDKTFNRASLPSVYTPDLSVKVPYSERGDMKPEKWVEEQLIKPLLTKMGWGREDVDYRTQVFLQLGRKKTEGQKVQSGKTDFSIFPFGDKRRCADIVIEAKGPGEMDGKKLHETFDQGESYASRQYAELLILADDKHLLLYVKSKDGNFKFTNTPYAEYAWKDLHN